MLNSIHEWITKPVVIRRINGWFTIFWLLWFIPAIAIGSFRNSVFLVAVYSIWANLISHYTAWLTARVEVRAERVEVDVDSGSEADKLKKNLK